MYMDALTQSKKPIFILFIVEFLASRRNKILALVGIGLYEKLS